MARLYSIDKKVFLDIKINSLENKYETNKEEWTWIISKVHFSHNEKKIIDIIGSYFDLGEMKILIAYIKNLLDKKISYVKSDFLEPNLELKITVIEENKYIISALFRKFINYERGKIKDTNESTKRINFTTNSIILSSFTKELELEMQRLANAKN